MESKIIKSILLLLIFCATMSVKAQTSGVKIKDLFVNKGDSSIVSNDSLTDLNVGFKIDSISRADKVHVLLGSSQNSGNVSHTVVNVVHQQNIHSLSLNGVSKIVNNFCASWPIQLFNSLSGTPLYLTVFVDDLNGNPSSYLSIKLTN